MFSFPCTGDNLSDFDITQNESHASPSLREAIRRKNPQPDFGSRSNVGTAQEIIVEQSFPSGGEVNILGISVLQVSSYRPQADGKSLLCSRGKYSRNKVVPAHPSGEPSSARLERRGCPGQPFMRAGHETLTNRSPNWSGLFLMPLFASGRSRGKRSRNFPENKFRSVSLPPRPQNQPPEWPQTRSGNSAIGGKVIHIQSHGAPIGGDPLGFARSLAAPYPVSDDLGLRARPS